MSKDQVAEVATEEPATIANPDGQDFFDLGTYNLQRACDTPYPLVLRHPVTGAKTSAVIPLLGREAEAVQEFSRTRVNANLQKQSMGVDDDEKPSIEASEARQIDLLAVAIFASGQPWSNVGLDGKRLDYTLANIKLLLTREKWVRLQVDAAFGNLANFLKA